MRFRSDFQINEGACESLMLFGMGIYLEALWQRCAIHFYRNVWGPVGSTTKVREVASRSRSSIFQFPSEHWRSLRTNNPMEWLIGKFDGEPRSVCVPRRQQRLDPGLGTPAPSRRHLWGRKRYMDMTRLNGLAPATPVPDKVAAGQFAYARGSR